MQSRDEYVAKIKLQLDELNAQISELEARAKKSHDEAKDRAQEQMTHLRRESRTAIAKLDELKAAGENGWVAMVAEMEKMRDAFAHSFNYFKSQV